MLSVYIYRIKVLEDGEFSVKYNAGSLLQELGNIDDMNEIGRAIELIPGDFGVTTISRSNGRRNRHAGIVLSSNSLNFIMSNY